MSKKLLIVLGGIVLLGVMLLFAMQLTAPSRMPNADAETFALANQLYDKGQYAESVILYEQLLNKGVENADLYYNAGTAYAALKEAGKASDAFQHARELAPRDAQIAQAAPTGQFSVPMTQNEMAMIVLGLVGCVALVIVVARRREALSVAR